MRLTAIVPCLLLTLNGCASSPVAAERQKLILIDAANLRALGPDWESDLVDCSDAVFRCLEAPGRFLMAFPRSCPQDNWNWMIAGYRFRLTAPMVHYGVPSGGYVSYKYPHAHLSYRVQAGFTSLQIRPHPVMTDDGGGSSMAEYGIKYAGDVSPFQCR